MIDPYRITNFERSDAELQEFWLFAIVVAGKGADQQSKKLEAFLSELPSGTPFEKIQQMIDTGSLGDLLRKHKLGQYNRIEKSFEQSLVFDLRTAEVSELETIFGVSFKTSRFFVMHSRPDIKVAALDTHILKFLGEMGIEVPKATPSSSSLYAKLEQEFLRLAEGSRFTLAELDLYIWSHYASKNQKAIEFI